ncbi:hypothetical protein Dimus_037078, partial [Dionaea muscipula]
MRTRKPAANVAKGHKRLRASIKSERACKVTIWLVCLWTEGEERTEIQYSCQD